MVLSNSTPNHNQSKQTGLILDTAGISSADLSELLQLNDEIEERRAQRVTMMGDGSGLLKATMTREEVFEVSSLDDDRFLTALEHQNSYVASPRVPVTDLDLSSIENLMKYFDEEVPVTPTKLAATAATCHGKVASALASFKSKATAPAVASSVTPSKPIKGKVNINELKQKYEQAKDEPQPGTPSVPTTPKPLKFHMKVKEMAQLFNAKINQVMRRDSETQQYATLHNEYSPEPKPAAKPVSPAAINCKRIEYQSNFLPATANKSQLTHQPHNPCLVAEEVFRELSVKDKALLFNKFVDDMSAKHPKFHAHAAGLEQRVKKQIARGEVISEQQASVKHLTQELEAKCILNTSASPPRPAAKPCTSPAVPAVPKTPESSSLHISTLTVVLKPSPEPRRCILSPAKRSALVAASECTHKRNIASVRCALPTEAYAPPKKIRRTYNERSSGENKMFFQNEQLENLFYTWLREENGVLFDITSVSNAEQTIEIAIEDEEPSCNGTNNTTDVTQKSAVERLLEEAIAKLEESKSKEWDIDTAVINKLTELKIVEVPELELDSPTSTTSSTATPSVTPRKCMPRKVKRPAPPVPAPRPSLQNQSTCISSSSVSSSCKHSAAEESESGLSTLPKITSDESQPEANAAPEANQADFEFPKPMRPPRKKKMRRTLTWKKENSIVEATTAVTSTDSDSDYKKNQTPHVKKKSTAQPIQEQSYIELDKSLMRHVNSPRKIKSAYTLTVLSSPSPNAESDQSESPRQSLDQTLPMNKARQMEPRVLTDSFIDQGFETGSNDTDRSPLSRRMGHRRELHGITPTTSPRPTLEGVKPSCFSTPVKGQTYRSSFNHFGSSAQQQLFSPIAQLANKQQRDPRRSSLAMQVIKEDHPLDVDVSSSAPATPNSFSANESAFFANAPTADMPSNLDDLTMSKPVSNFWMNAGDFTISLEIFHNAPDRLRLLYEIFTQKSCEPRELAFGIDGHKFSLNKENMKPSPERLPNAKDCSHYWFSSGDVAVPFSGKHMPAEKVQRLFKFISEEMEAADELRFGVDHIEFSSTPEFWVNTPKFSIESSYSMLVGLQAGHSNGLEGRGKYAWPNNSNVIKTSDLDHSEIESDSFSNSGRLSFSPDMFSQDYEHVPLDELFEKQVTPRKISSRKSGNMSMAQMVETMQQQQNKLKATRQSIRRYAKPDNPALSNENQSRESPEYVNKLRAIINAIGNIGRHNGFQGCSMEQLESFMYFLCEYEDICLANCTEHMDKILDTLLDRRAVAV